MEVAEKIRVGVAGWSYPDWVGIVYPSSCRDRLGLIASLVDLVEINSTFYRPPESRITGSWLARVQKKEDFFFTAKLHRDFTHEGRFDPAMIRQFKDGFAPLLEAGRLRHLLMQFRYDFAADDDGRAHLRRLVDAMRDTFSIVVEVRHRSWQEQESLEFLKSLGVILCNLDYPVGASSFDLQEVISDDGYMRMHGRNYEKWFTKSDRDETYDYFYSREELEGILRRIEILADRCETYTVIANNHYKGAELANALELKNMLTGLKFAVPEGLLQRYPRLSEITLNRRLFDNG